MADKFKALSLFSSAGIAETYFEKNGIEVVMASEILPERVKIYKCLYPKVKVIEGDISNKDIYKNIITTGNRLRCDFIIATPPCQGMSTAGKQLKNDPRNRLIIQVVEIIKELEPKFIIIENVPEIINTKIEVANEIISIDSYLKKELSSKYFFNNNPIVNSMYYGVAQSRERCIYLLSNKKTNIKWEFPPPLKKIITMKDVIGDLPSLDPKITDISKNKFFELFPNYYLKKEVGLQISKWHFPPRHKLRHVISMQHTPEGCSAWANKIYYPTKADGTKSKGFKNTYKRQWWDKPAYTVTKYTSRLGSQENGHPGRVIINSPYEEDRLWSDPRVLTIFELMRISSLPDNWDVPNWAGTNLIREIIGEGIPPKMLEYAIKELWKNINERN